MIYTYIPLKWKGSVEGGNGMSDWKQNIVKCYPLSCDFIRMEDRMKPYTKVGPRRHQVYFTVRKLAIRWIASNRTWPLLTMIMLGKDSPERYPRLTFFPRTSHIAGTNPSTSTSSHPPAIIDNYAELGK
ncbi:potassium channel beta 1 subunit related protein [Neurospora crassa]|nr:potassium channel beta 1 subunit related protein [imported] - Neurospora crassa [Neurospora crassa]KHE87129.1 potassium channel beta 1 subunit related protein [Neurospora crassa]